MLMSSNKGETAVHGCHCPGDMVVRMRKVLAIPRSWYVCFTAVLKLIQVFLVWHQPKRLVVIACHLCAKPVCLLRTLISIITIFHRFPSCYSRYFTCGYSSCRVRNLGDVLARCPQWSDMGIYSSCNNHYFSK